jgi:hypothetical protein
MSSPRSAGSECAKDSAAIANVAGRDHMLLPRFLQHDRQRLK